MKMLLMPGKYHDVQGRWLRVLRLREKRTYRSQEVQETYVKKTRDIWLLGPPQSGKSSAMQRLLAHSAQIWARWPVLSCLATDPLSRWCDQAPLQTVVDAQGRSYVSLKGEEKIDALLAWSTQHTWVLVLDDAPTYSVYRLVMGSVTQVGIVAAVSVDDYDEGRVRIHEYTRPDKELDRVKHIEALDAQDEPVFQIGRASCRERV